MPVVERLSKVRAALNKLGKKYGKPRVSVVVGYTQNYALYVHENKQAHHTVGQSKFLEEPARTKQLEIRRAITEGVKSSGSLETGLYIGGLLLQRESQQLVPVDLGALKASAFTAREQELESVSRGAFNKSETIRKRSTR